MPAAIASAWGVRARAGRGPKPGLSLDRIVDAAVSVADAEGLTAVSMNRVAKQLGSSPMSLYRYLESKDELLALMVDAAFGPVPPHADDEDWRAGLQRWAWGVLDAMQAHSWAVRVPITGPPIAPNSVAWLDDALRSLRDTGLAEAEKASVVMMLTGYVRHHVMLMGEIQAHMFASPSNPDDAMRAYSDAMRRLTDPDRFPALRLLLDAGVFEQADPPEEEFAFGLDRLLDGVAALVRERA